MGDKSGNKWCVYIHTTPSGKKYVGITSRRPEDRFGHGTGYKGNKYFYNAIKKHGWESITHEVIERGLTKEEACAKERELIARYGTTNPENGYNLTTGGESYEFPEEVKARLRKPKNFSEETRLKLSKQGKSAYEKNLKGRAITEEQRKKISEAKRGIKPSDETRLKRGESIRKHIEQYGYSEDHKKKISEALKGRKHTQEALEKMRAAKSPENNPRSRRVAMIKDGEVVSVYCSAREAMRETGISYTSIVRVCNHVRLKQAGGYKWEYV